MKKLALVIIFHFFCQCVTGEPLFILNDSYISDIYNAAKNDLEECKDVSVIKDVRGIIIRINLDNPLENYVTINSKMKKNLLCVGQFLAKIKNAVIIEVHTEKVPNELNIRNWEFSSVVAGNIGDFLVNNNVGITVDRINIVGYGEFLPVINTSNNGGNLKNRVDIIILNN